MFTVPETVAPLVGDVMVQESVVAVTQAWDALQVWPVGQVPQVPVQPSVPQVLLVQFGVQVVVGTVAETVVLFADSFPDAS